MTGEIETALQDVINAELNQRLNGNRQKVEAVLVDWLTNKARKKPVPDLNERLREMGVEIKRMVEDLSLSYEAGKLVVKASGMGDETLRKLRLGTLWFEPAPDILTMVMAGMYQ